MLEAQEQLHVLRESIVCVIVSVCQVHTYCLVIMAGGIYVDRVVVYVRTYLQEVVDREHVIELSSASIIEEEGKFVLHS